MTFLLNIIPTIIFMVGAFVAYRYFKRGKFSNVVYSIITTLLLLLVYNQIQPSYLPKNGVKPLTVLPLEETTKPVMQDTLLKPVMDEQERSKHFEENVLTYDEDIKKILQDK